MSFLRARVTAEEAWHRYVFVLGLQSLGTYGLAVSEAQAAGCTAGDDSDEMDKPHDHAFVEMPDLSPRQQKRIARELAAAATQRGALFEPQGPKGSRR
jgi:hypothetical protein